MEQQYYYVRTTGSSRHGRPEIPYSGQRLAIAPNTIVTSQHYTTITTISTTTPDHATAHCLPPSPSREKNPRTSVRLVEGLKRFTSSRLWSEDPEISPGWVWVVLLLLVCFLCCCLGFNTVYYKWNQVSLCTPHSLQYFVLCIVLQWLITHCVLRSNY